MSDAVRYEQDDHVVTITYNRPGALNAVNGEMRQGLNAAWDRFLDDQDAWVAIVTGEGDVFCAGADIKDGKGSVGTWSGTFWEVPTINSFESGLELFKPTIAAINGPCIGYGLTAALTCDFLIASDRATFAYPEVSIGVPTIVGALRLPPKVGWANAMELLLTGETIDAERAREIGLAWKVVPHDDLVAEARALAARLCAAAPLAARATKEIAYRGARLPWLESVRMGETMRKVAMSTRDAKEGIAAFRERREPEWEGALMTGQIKLELEPPVATLVIDNPDRRNAMNMAMYRAMADQVGAARAHDDVRVILVRGEGHEAFGAGSDISEFAEARTGDAAGGYDQVEHLAQDALRRVDLPVVASIRGACMGGGAAIALCADIRYASETAVFAIPPARLGIGYPIDAVESLVAAVGAPRAKELLFTARRVAADEALAIGLVHRVVPGADLDDAVSELTTQLAANAPLTIRAAKLAIDQLARPVDGPDPEAVRAAVDACYASDDYREGVAAFTERRSPEFRGH